MKFSNPLPQRRKSPTVHTCCHIHISHGKYRSDGVNKETSHAVLPYHPNTAIATCKVGQLRKRWIHFSRFMFSRSDVFKEYPPEGILKSEWWCRILLHTAESYRANTAVAAHCMKPLRGCLFHSKYKTAATRVAVKLRANFVDLKHQRSGKNRSAVRGKWLVTLPVGH